MYTCIQSLQDLQRYARFAQVGERGYVSFGERFYGYLFDELPQSEDLALLLPLYAAQDIACGDSRIFYHVYSSDDNDALTRAVVERISDEMQELDENFEASTVVVITWYDTQPYRCTFNNDFYGPRPVRDLRNAYFPQ